MAFSDNDHNDDNSNNFISSPCEQTSEAGSDSDSSLSRLDKKNHHEIHQDNDNDHDHDNDDDHDQDNDDDDDFYDNFPAWPASARESKYLQQQRRKRLEQR